MDFTAWLRTWVARHPLKEPMDTSRTAYTTEVMERVKALAPTPNLAPSQVRNNLVWGWGWPRLAVGLATAAAAVFVVFTMDETRHQRRLARSITDQAEILTALDEDALPPDEDLLLLAETPATDEEWLEQTLQLLEELDEELPADAASEDSEAEWLQELEML